MPNEEEKKVGIPESVTIGGVTYAVKDTPELQKFVQEIAKVEKSKLYTQFENLKSQIQNLGRAKIEGEGSTFDMDALVEKLKDTFVTKEDFKMELPNVLKEVVQPVLSATEESRKNDLKEYREKLINDNLATCIPDLVVGETKEELDAALQRSIQLRASYPTPSSVRTQGQTIKDPLIAAQAAQMENQAQTPTPQIPSAQPAPTTRPTIPTAPSRPSPEVTGPRNVKAMSMSEFENKRASLLADLEATYGA